jgi:hypothetical protein
MVFILKIKIDTIFHLFNLKIINFIYNTNIIRFFMPRLKIANSKTRITKSEVRSSDVSSSVSGNIQVIKSQINLKNNDYINVKNACKILESYSNWNGYIKIYTEVENNFELGDTVYITYLEPTIDDSIFNLDNLNAPDFYMGYKVLFVNHNKNEIVINRRFNDITSGKVLKDMAISKLTCRGGNYYQEIADGVVFFNCNIFNSELATIEGYVSGSTGVVSGATILCVGLTTETNENGFYSFDVPTGENYVKCFADGYITQTQLKLIESGVVNVLDFILVEGANTITITPNTDSTCFGDTIILSATTVGYDGMLTYRWQINEQNIGTDNFIFSYNNFNDGDQVTCTVQDEFNTSISNIVTINIIPSTLFITVDPSSTINSGQVATFTVNDSCYTNPIYEWRVNDIIVGSNSITYSSSTINDGDIVHCNVGAFSSNQIVMTVITPSTTTTTSSTILDCVLSGYIECNITLECTLDGTIECSV